jgi:hypothetical protein
VVSFMTLPLYPQGKNLWYPLDRRLGGPQSRSGRGGEGKNSQPLPGLESPIIQPVAQRYVVKGKSKYVPVLNSAPRMEHELGTGGLAPRILNIGATRRWSTSCLGRCTPSEKTRLLLRGEDANWAPEPVCILWQTQKSPSQPGFEPWSSSSTDLTILHVRLIRGWQAYSCCRENSF